MTLIPPEIISFSPIKVTKPNQIITIYGKYFSPNVINSRVLVKGSNANIINSWQDSIQIKLPNSVIPEFYVSLFDTVEIRLIVAEQSMVAEDKLEIYWHSTWTRKNDFPGFARHNAVAFSIGNYGYFGTGLKGTSTIGTPLKDFWKYDPNSDQWVEITDFPGDHRAWASSFTIGSTGYVGLGSPGFNEGNPDNNGSFFMDFFSYNPDLGVWDKIDDFPGIGRRSAASFSINNKGYIATGRLALNNPIGYQNGTKDAWYFDPALDLWTEIEDFPNFSFQAVGFQLNNTGYIYNYNELFEYRNNTWIKLSAPVLNTYSNIAFGIYDFAYFGLGQKNPYLGTNLLYEYDPITSEVIAKSLSNSVKIWGASVFVIDNKAYVIGGYNRESLKDVWEFDPSKPEL